MKRPLLTLFRFALIFTLAAPAAGFGQTGVYDVSGDRGTDDPDGRPSYATGSSAFPGVPGDDGGDAQEVVITGPDGRRRLRKKGWDAGSLVLHLTATADAKRIDVRGTAVEQEKRRTFTITGDSYPLDSSTSFRLRAVGGPGGDGGTGGRGQDGGSGFPGKPAYFDGSREHVGTDGTQGARGGDEGRSTDGGDAGHGGQIDVFVDRFDADLAMLIDENNVAGNEGGRPGKRLGPGEGGPGGPGGAGASYQRAVTRQVDVYGQNEKGETVVVGTRDEPGTETVYIRGGNAGWPGPDGSSYPYSPKWGNDSRPGQFHYHVKGKDGRYAKYTSVYRIAIMPGFQMTGSHNGRLVKKKAKGSTDTTTYFEPGETTTLTGLRVKNTGGAPTPEMQAIRLFISDTQEWIVSNGEELVIPRSLAPGEEYVFDQPITFHLRERRRDVAGPLRGTDVVAPRAIVSRVEREFVHAATELNGAAPINVRYPIEINVVENLVTIAPGEAQALTFSVKNTSNQALGKSIDFDKLREARTLFRKSAGTIREDAFVMAGFKDNGYVHPVDGILQALENLGPGEETFITTYIGFTGGAEHYTNVRIQPELFLESILNPGQINRIQYEPRDVTVAKAYVFNPKHKALIITNHGLTAPALNAIEAVGSIMHVGFDIWDFSYYGHFDLRNSNGVFDSFFEAYRGKTLFILGNLIKTPGEDLRVPELQHAKQIIEAARRWGIKVVVLDTSGDPAGVVKSLVEPVPLREPDEEGARDYAGIKDFKRELRAGIQRAQREEGNESEFLGIHRVRINRTPWWPWWTPTPEWLRGQAERVGHLTDYYLPETKYYPDPVFNPVEMKRRLWLWPKYSVGWLSVGRSVDDARTSAVVVPMPAQELNNPDFIVSREFQTVINLGLNFNQKLDLLNSIMLGRWHEEASDFKVAEAYAHVSTLNPLEYAGALLDSVLLELLNEQMTIRPLERWSGVAEKELWYKLNLLRQVCYADYSQFGLRPDTPAGELFVDFVVALRFFNKAITTPWQRWFSAYQSKNLQTSFATAKMIEYFVDHVFADPKAAREVIEARLKSKRDESGGLARDQLMDVMDPMNLRQFLYRDGDVNRAVAERVRDHDQAQALIDADARRRARNADVKERVRVDIDRMKLKPEECQAFLAGHLELKLEVKSAHPKRRRSVVPSISR